jgi:hypothetical protein
MEQVEATGNHILSVQKLANAEQVVRHYAGGKETCARGDNKTLSVSRLSFTKTKPDSHDKGCS